MEQNSTDSSKNKNREIQNKHDSLKDIIEHFCVFTKEVHSAFKDTVGELVDSPPSIENLPKVWFIDRLYNLILNGPGFGPPDYAENREIMQKEVESILKSYEESCGYIRQKIPLTETEGLCARFYGVK
jgi:hypothetical protein